MKLRSEVVFMLIGVCALTLGSLNASAQLLANPKTTAEITCREINEAYPLSFPEEKEGADEGGRMQLRAELQLDCSTHVRVFELQSPPDNGVYNSTISISGNWGEQRLLVPSLIRRGEGLRLTQTSVICDQSNRPLLILGFDAGWAGAVQGFVTVQRSAGKLQVLGFPIVRYGKLVVNRKSLGKATLWSAEAEDQGQCDACKKPYVIRDCHLGEQKWVCTKRSKETAPFYPNAVTAKTIEIK